MPLRDKFWADSGGALLTLLGGDVRPARLARELRSASNRRAVDLAVPFEAPPFSNLASGCG
jgi:hypothetical protein